MKTLLISLSDIVDVCSKQDKAIKKSLEFFLGRLLDMRDLEDFRAKCSPQNNLECIKLFLEDKGVYLREKALLKKFLEYYMGREFDGLIADCSLLLSKKQLGRLSSKYEVVLFSSLGKAETDFLLGMLKIQLPVINADSVQECLVKLNRDDVLFAGTEENREASKTGAKSAKISDLLL
ncbi:hypothetical protein GF323_00230 [Candidatus Woesearchaeota archaeon]|nr:hypothetical protein [Candidatus Woesearchaeota archaeon]